MTLTHRPEIDGLRAVAVLPVIAYHAGFPGFSGGFVGVDVFFVISGYLITGILAGDLADGRWSVARFYERRARRILPALFVMLAASCAAAWVWLMPPQFKDFSASVFAVALFVSNMLFISEVDYFAPSADEIPLLHTWSLAVEEQFYILFPLILWLMWRLGRRRGLVWGVAAITVLSLAFSEWAWRAAPAQSFYFLPSRAWELGVGALCALIPPRVPPRLGWLREGLALAGLATILVSVAVLSRDDPFPSLWTAIPVGGAAAVILFAPPGTRTARLLSGRIPVTIGLISYSAYLWHVPLFVFGRFALGATPGLPAMAAIAALSLILAALSWRFVEQPLRSGRGRSPALPRRGQVFAASLAGIAGFAAFGLWGYLSEGRAALWLRGATPAERQTYALFAPAHAVARFLDDGGCRFNQRTVTPEAVTRLTACAARHGPGLAVVGDSHAIDLADSLIAARAAPFVFGMTQGNCRPDAPRGECGYDGFLALVGERPGLFSRVVFEIAGQRMIEGPGGRRTNGLFRYYAPDDAIPEGDIAIVPEILEANATWVETVARHVPTVWLTPRVEPQIPEAHVMARGCGYPFALRPGLEAIFTRLTEAIAERIAGGPAQVLDQPAALHFTMPQDFVTCAALHWADGDHLSPSGRAWLAERLAPVLVP